MEKDTQKKETEIKNPQIMNKGEQYGGEQKKDEKSQHTDTGNVKTAEFGKSAVPGSSPQTPNRNFEGRDQQKQSGFTGKPSELDKRQADEGQEGIRKAS